jgi:hypothetical protein
MADLTAARPVGRFLHDRLGGSPSAARYYNEDESVSVVIVTLTDVPVPDWAVFSTTGLSQVPNLLEGDDIRVELLACAGADDDAMRNVLATCAFNVASSGWLAAPGVVFRDVVTEYLPDATVPHVMWTEPFFADGLSTVTIPDVGTIHWLQGVPLTDREVDYLERHGFDELEARLAGASAEYFDLWRESVC